MILSCHLRVLIEHTILAAETFTVHSHYKKMWIPRKYFSYGLRNLRTQKYLALHVFDGAAVVHLIPTTIISTFNEYACDVFIPHKKHFTLNVLMWCGI